MVYRKISDEERLAEPDDVRRKRQRREGMARAREKDPKKFNKRALNYYHANKEKVNKAAAKYRNKLREENPSLMLWRYAKTRAAKKGLEFTILPEDIIIPNNCPITNLELQFGKDSIKQNSPTLDRIDNSKGYITGNIAVISNKANTCKRDLSLEEIERLYFYSKGIDHYY